MAPFYKKETIFILVIDFLEYWYCMCCVGFCIDIYITPGEIELTVIYVEIITYH